MTPNPSLLFVNPGTKPYFLFREDFTDNDKAGCGDGAAAPLKRDAADTHYMFRRPLPQKMQRRRKTAGLESNFF